jgi:hypothetical protein
MHSVTWQVCFDSTNEFLEFFRAIDSYHFSTGISYQCPQNLRTTGQALRRAGLHTYESVPGELKLVIKTDMSTY